MTSIDGYAETLDEPARSTSKALRAIIDSRLKGASSRLYHGSPAWFIDENPIVGYSRKKEGVALLFWSGQSFETAGLKPIGKFKAAEAVFRSREDVDGAPMRKWLLESIAIQWNYKDIIRNKGNLERLG